MQFPDSVTRALKKALVNVFWTKKDLRELFRRCEVPASLTDAQDWNGYKFHIIDPVIDSLNGSAEGLARCDESSPTLFTTKMAIIFCGFRTARSENEKRKIRWSICGC